MDICCRHNQLNEAMEGYHYRINKSQVLWLCDACELRLRKQMFRQAIIERDLDGCDY